MSGRTRKVESQLKEIAGEEVASLSDPRIQGIVTVTGVRVSPDLAQATVFYSVLAGEDAEAAHEGLQSAAGRVQAAVGAQTRLRRTPRLRFEPDPVVDQATRIEAALREVRTDSIRTTNNTAREVAELLKTLDRVAVTTHVGADGDAIGASAALVRLMRHLGAEAVFCHAEAVPTYLEWLLPDEALRELPSDHELLMVDTSRADRAGVPVPEAGARLNLDHHEDNPLYAEFNLLDPKAAASAEIVAGLYTELGVPIDKPAAEALYVGIRTDTGGFTFRNISPRAHELVADLLRAGAVPAEVSERINRRGSIEQLRIVGVSLANAVRYGEVLVSTVENADYERTGATELDSKESIDQLRTVAGIDVVAHLREVPEGTKGSLRSETVDVGEIARRFGGGGHRLAAGYTTPRRPQEAREELLGILRTTSSVDLGGGR